LRIANSDFSRGYGRTGRVIDLALQNADRILCTKTPAQADRKQQKCFFETNVTHGLDQCKRGTKTEQ